MRYQVTIHLDNGDQVQAKATAQDEAQALYDVTHTPQFADFAGTAKIASTHIKQMPDEDSTITPDRYTLQPSEESGWHVATDRDNLFIVRFKEHQYNGTAQIKQIKDFPLDALKVATLLREVSDWLALTHPDIL